MESAGLRLQSFAAIDDKGCYLLDARLVDLANCRFGCDFFKFARDTFLLPWRVA